MTNPCSVVAASFTLGMPDTAPSRRKLVVWRLRARAHCAAWRSSLACSKLVSNYYDYYSRPAQGAGPLPTGYTLLAAEQTLTVPIPHTEHCLYTEPLAGLLPPCDGCGCGPPIANGWMGNMCACRGGRVMDFPTIAEKCSCCVDTNYLEGTFDGVVHFQGDGALFPLEHKTFSRHPTDDGLQHNEQFLRYLWLATRSNIVPPDETQRWKGILYNGLWKRATVPSGRVWDDMFHRAFLERSPEELDRCTTHLQQVSMEMCLAALPQGLRPVAPARPVDAGSGQHQDSRWALATAVYKTVPPVDGCNGLMQCVFKDMCDADELSPGHYWAKRQSHYVPRLRTPAFALEDGASND